MPAPYIPGPPAYQSLASSPRIGRFGVHRRSVTIRDCPIANHTGLTNMITAYGTNVLPEGSVIQKASDGNWYLYGVTLPTTTPATTQQFLTLAAGGVPTLAILIDPVDTAFNGAGNPMMGAGYMSGDFVLAFLVFATGTTYNATIDGFLKANDIFVEGSSQVLSGAYPGTGYGASIPREDAPV